MARRPSQSVQQAEEWMAAPMTGRWRWLFAPDPRWLNAVNTTNLRTVNATRMFVGVTVVWALMYVAVVVYALTRCGIVLTMFGRKFFQLLPPPGRLSVMDWRLCEESIATVRMLDFATGTLNTYALLLAAMAGIALGAFATKRLSDTEHRVEVEKAKKAPVILTGEHQAPQQQVNVMVEESAKPRPTGDARSDDERGEV